MEMETTPDDRKQKTQAAFNIKQKLTVVVMDILLLSELGFCVYLGHMQPEDMAAIFLRNFIPMVMITLIAARVVIRRFDKVPPQAHD
jgi:hypothetical protein